MFHCSVSSTEMNLIVWGSLPNLW